MSAGVVFEEAALSGSLSGLSRQNAAHVDPGVTCNALPYGRRKIDDRRRITDGVILREDRGVGMRSRRGRQDLTTSLA